MSDKLTTEGLNLSLLILGIYFIVTGLLLNLPFGQDLVARIFFLPRPITEPNFMAHFGVFYLVFGVLCFQARMAKAWVAARPMVLTLIIACFLDAIFTPIHMEVFGTFPKISYLLAGGASLLVGLILLLQYRANNK